MTPEEKAAQQKQREAEERKAQGRAQIEREKGDRLEEIVRSGAIGTVFATGDRDEALAHRLTFVDVSTLSEREFEAVTNGLTGHVGFADLRVVSDVLQRAGK